MDNWRVIDGVAVAFIEKVGFLCSVENAVKASVDASMW